MRIGRSIAILIVAIVVPTIASVRSGSAHPTFENPPMLVSQDGKLDVDLVAAPASYIIEGHRFDGMLYNGSYIPAVWRVQPGDKLSVTLHNQLAEQTNLHFHGLNVSPLGNGDNVYLHINPGETFHYQVTIPQSTSGSFGSIRISTAMSTSKSSAAFRVRSSSKEAIASIRFLSR